MTDETDELEAEFFAAVDRNTEAEQAIFDALVEIDDEQYYTLFEVEVEHTCGPARRSQRPMSGSAQARRRPSDAAPP